MKNLIAAYSLRGPPHIPIKKYIGRSIISQKTNHRKKSNEQKSPIIPKSRRRYIAKYPFWAFLIFQLAKVATKHTIAVRSIIGAEMPSNPIRYSIFRSPMMGIPLICIHWYCSTNCIVAISVTPGIFQSNLA